MIAKLCVSFPSFLDPSFHFLGTTISPDSKRSPLSLAIVQANPRVGPHSLYEISPKTHLAHSAFVHRECCIEAAASRHIASPFLGCSAPLHASVESSAHEYEYSPPSSSSSRATACLAPVQRHSCGLAFAAGLSKALDIADCSPILRFPPTEAPLFYFNLIFPHAPRHHSSNLTDTTNSCVSLHR